MSDESIFSGATPPVEEPAAPVVTTTPQIPTEVAELVGEGKKYKTTEEALKALPHAQAHIQKLEDEAKQIREELAKRKAVEEVLAEFKASTSKQSDEGTPPAKLEVAELEKLVEKVIENKQSVEVAKTNTTSVVKKMSEKFGEKAEQEYIKLAEENGMTIPQLNALAARSPNAVLKLAGITVSKTTPPAKPESSINTDGFTNNQPQEKSARVVGRSTKDMVAAWKVAGEKVNPPS